MMFVKGAVSRTEAAPAGGTVAIENPSNSHHLILATLHSQSLHRAGITVTAVFVILCYNKRKVKVI